MPRSTAAFTTRLPHRDLQAIDDLAQMCGVTRNQMSHTLLRCGLDVLGKKLKSPLIRTLLRGAELAETNDDIKREIKELNDSLKAYRNRNQNELGFA